jgi:hypothetical protein
MMGSEPGNPRKEKTVRNTLRVTFGALVTLVILGGVIALSETPTQARIICECADLDNPVICKGGRIYSNPCVAACFGATHCRPYGG